MLLVWWVLVFLLGFLIFCSICLAASVLASFLVEPFPVSSFSPRMQTEHKPVLKGAQAWDIRSIGFSWFLHHKVSTCGCLWGFKKKFKIFRGSFRGAKFLTRMTSLFKEVFFLSKLGPKNFFSVELLRPIVSVNNDFLQVSFFMYLKNYWKNLLPYAYAPAFMRTLSIRVRNWCASWAFAQGTGAHAEHTHQELMLMLSIHISFPIFQTAFL